MRPNVPAVPSCRLARARQTRCSRPSWKNAMSRRWSSERLTGRANTWRSVSGKNAVASSSSSACRPLTVPASETSGVPGWCRKCQFFCRCQNIFAGSRLLSIALLQRLPHIGRKPLLTVLDDGSHSTKPVRLKARRGGYQLGNFGVIPLPARATADHTIRNAGRAVPAIRDLLRMSDRKPARSDAMGGGSR